MSVKIRLFRIFFAMECESRRFTNLNHDLVEKKNLKVSKKDLRWLKMALDLSEKSTHSKQKLASIIVQRNKIVGKGFNQYKSHPIQKGLIKVTNSIHAEVSAIVSARKKSFFFPRATIYVARTLQSTGGPGCSYPCESCFDMIKRYKIKNIVCYDINDSPIKIEV